MSKGLDTKKRLKAGSLASMIAVVFGHPVDTIKVRLQTLPPSTFKGPLDCLIKSVRREGVFSLFKGITTPLLISGCISATSFGTYSYCYNYFSHLLPEKLQLDPRYLAPYLSGGVAGAIAALLVSPSDLVKTNMQTSLLEKKKLWVVVKEIVQKRGVMGIFYGLTSTIIRDTGGGALWFGNYHIITQWAVDFHGPEWNKTALEQLLIGGTVGVINSLINHPTDVIKSRVQNGVLEVGQERPKWFKTVKQIYREGNGVKLFYRGMGPQLMRNMIITSVLFFAFEKLSPLV
eukprot:TRINITY_DN7919_c0_g1_i1.p1 TRINITY_DN7919_c0_g1~~TRINITY_DN7919_c0_g1_i1.p1  ORF type:complete len:289 (-),score=23.05 TRINITY_DN7919_c0_g1_i1:274-1140(-)